MTFLPQDYDKNENLNETGGSYMRFQEGENKFRILASPIVGWEWWNEVDGKRKPNRVRINETIDVSKVDDEENVKRFWAMPVWNYATKKIEILEITQKGLQNTLKALSKDEEWGSPLEYNISVIRTGKDLGTTYELIPSPPKPLDKEIADKFKEAHINLEALFDGDDPFSASSKELDEMDEAIG
jgi:hypothetical protein